MDRLVLDFKAAIFDMDGTIIDTLGIWEEIDGKFLAKRGIAIPPDYFKHIGAMSFMEAAKYTIERFSLTETPEEILAEWTLLADMEYEVNTKLFPHVLEYLQLLESHGIKIALATGALERFYSLALRGNGIDRYFDATCSVDDVGKGKGQPDVYYLAMERLGVEPKDCVIFEDVEVAIATAATTGAVVFGVHNAEVAPDGVDDPDNVFRIKDFRFAPIPKG